MKLQKLYCPGCGASLGNEEDLQYCMYCGRKIIITPDHSTSHIRTIIDHAKIKEAESHFKEIEYRHKENIEQIRAHKEEKAAEREERLERKLLFPGIWLAAVVLLWNAGSFWYSLLAIPIFIIGLPFVIFCLIRK